MAGRGRGREIFVISDTHFDHANILTFVDKNDQLIRGQFRNVDHMNETMINNWNRVVGPQDTIYHLGDFTFGGKGNIERFASRLNGKKRLIMGNHDYEAKLYYPWFQKVMSWRQFGDLFSRPIFMTHFPLHESSFTRRDGRKNPVNIHGHIHQNQAPTEFHINVSVEQINYTPKSIESLLS